MSCRTEVLENSNEPIKLFEIILLSPGYAVLIRSATCHVRPTVEKKGNSDYLNTISLVALSGFLS